MLEQFGSKCDETRLFKTICHHCIFNKTKLTENIDCELGRYKRFLDRGEINQDNSVARLCSACRDITWERKRKDEGATGDRLSQIFDELINAYSLIIYEKGTGTLDNLKETLSVNQLVPFKQIIFAYKDNTDIEEIFNYLSEFTKHTKTKFNLLRIMDSLNEREIIDYCTKKCTGLMYILCKNGEKLKGNEIEKLFHKIDKELDKLIYVAPYNSGSLTGMSVNYKFHQIVNGNMIKNIEEKVLEAFENEDLYEYGTTWENLVEYNNTNS